MRTRRIIPVIARIRLSVAVAAHLANVYVGGILNARNPVLPRLPLHCEYRAYTAGRDWRGALWRRVYRFF